MNAFLSIIKLGYLYTFSNKIIDKVVIKEKTCSNIKIRTYETESSFSTLIVLHGMNPQGYDESRLTSFCKALASVGFRVYTPNLEGFQDLTMDIKDIMRIIDTIKVASEDCNSKVGVLGFSFGATYGIIATASKEVQNVVKYILSAGAYWSVENVISNAFSDKNASAYSRLALQWVIREQMGLSEEELEIYNKLMSVHYLKEGKFSEKEISLMDRILQEENKKESLDWWKDKLKDISLLNLKGNNYINKLKCEVLILHSMNDRVVPISEAYKILDELKKCNKKVYYCLSNTRGHVEYTKGKLLGVASIFYRMMKLR